MDAKNLGKIEVFCPYTTRQGKKIPPPNGKKVWHFWVPPKKDKKN